MKTLLKSLFGITVIIALTLTIQRYLGATADLVTTAEKTNFERTGRYDEVVRLCQAFEQTFRNQVNCQSFGKTPEGRPMLALIASSDGVLSPSAAKSKGRPVLLFQGGIHAGEIDGKDAGFLALRKLLTNEVFPGILKQVTLVFVPVFNIDGHERFGAYNRPNQRGPVEMGWRTTSWNLNLNRDYLKADSPEMVAMLNFLNVWDPILYVDLHVTDGADFEHDIAIMVHPSEVGPDLLKKEGSKLASEMMKRLSARGHLPLPFYPSLNEDDNPLSGFSLSVSPLRFSQAYYGSRNRLGILVETHSWKPYRQRVQSTLNTILELTDLGASEGTNWHRASQAADEEAKHFSGKEVALAYNVTDKSRNIDFRGVEYSRTHSEISGKLWTKYNPSKPQVWTVPLYDEIRPTLVVKAPNAGYVIPPGHAVWVSEKLRLHGVQFYEIKRVSTDIEVEVFRADQADLSKSSFEGRTGAKVTGKWSAAKRTIAHGSYFVPIAQARSLLALHLLEPQAPDSLLAWGYFNSIFERKEYMEDYVAEVVARELVKSAEIKAEFEKRLASDPAFAKSPEQRLEFFYRRHPSWDARYYLYPIYRVNRAP